MHNIRIANIIVFTACVFSSVACKKLIEIKPPIDSITTEQVFTNNKQAESAIAGVYSRMINGDNISPTAEEEVFSGGLVTLCGALSSDELYVESGNGEIRSFVLSTNRLTVNNAVYPNAIWKSAYKTIYDANGVIEGIAASKSELLSDSVRKQLTAEARTIRAFSYFYLTNFFGDLPLVLTIDYNKTKNLSRSSQQVIYQQIIKDLTESIDHLPADFSNGKSERIRINKWFAKAFLARVYLFTGQYQDAIDLATAVIDQTGLFTLEGDLNKVFLKNSGEAIWQLAQFSRENRNGAPDGKLFTSPLAGVEPRFPFTDYVLSLYEPTDKRRINWVNTYQESPTDPILHYPYKYKVGRLTYGAPVEYYTVMRLAELYLIRAEAHILSSGNTNAAISDLNVLRQRADVGELPFTLTVDEVKQAVADERVRELCAEWGHRWFDLKRTGKALDILPNVPHKQPWEGNYQLLYPIPTTEIEVNHMLEQNPEYDRI